MKNKIYKVQNRMVGCRFIIFQTQPLLHRPKVSNLSLLYRYVRETSYDEFHSLLSLVQTFTTIFTLLCVSEWLERTFSDNMTRVRISPFPICQEYDIGLGKRSQGRIEGYCILLRCVGMAEGKK